jgi:metallo-beta-lactamase class B
MKTKLLIFICTSFLFMPGKKSSAKTWLTKQTMQIAGAALNDTVILYKSDNLIIKKLSAHIYQHISFLNTESFGRVECNGMIVVNGHEAIIFDTPTNDTSSAELINYLVKTSYTITAIIPTHFHDDCVGGLEKFNEYNIPCYASNQTMALLKNKGKLFSNPIHGFNKKLTLKVGDKKVYIKYFGEGHTKDNVVGYFPEDKAVFGGCLIKEVDAGKGYLGDANVAAWPATVTKVKKAYPNAKIVIPGHGETGGTELFDYTIKLFTPVKTP